MKTTTIIAIVTAVLLLIAIVLLLVLGKPKKRTSLSKTKRIVYVALLTAVCTVLNIFTIPLSNVVWISFISIPCFIAGYLFGCIDGFAVGFIGDLIGALIHPQGAYMPIIGIASGIWGFIPGVLFTYVKGNEILKTVISYFLCFLICTVFLNTFGLWLLYGIGKKSFWAYLWVRLPWQALSTLINMLLAFPILAVFPHLLPKCVEIYQPEHGEQKEVECYDNSADDNQR